MFTVQILRICTAKLSALEVTSVIFTIYDVLKSNKAYSMWMFHWYFNTLLNTFCTQFIKLLLNLQLIGYSIYIHKLTSFTHLFVTVIIKLCVASVSSVEWTSQQETLYKNKHTYMNF